MVLARQAAPDLSFITKQTAHSPGCPSATFTSGNLRKKEKRARIMVPRAHMLAPPLLITTSNGFLPAALQGGEEEEVEETATAKAAGLHRVFHTEAAEEDGLLPLLLLALECQMAVSGAEVMSMCVCARKRA